MATANLRAIRLQPVCRQIDCRLDYTLDTDCEFVFVDAMNPRRKRRLHASAAAARAAPPQPAAPAEVS